MSINWEWELGLIKGELSSIQETLEKKHETLYGNGHEGLTSRVNGLENEMDKVTRWKEGWEKVTNYDDFRTMKQELQRLTKQSYLLTAIIIVAVFFINLFGPRLSDAIAPSKEAKVIEHNIEPEVHYIYKNIPPGTAGDDSTIPTDNPENSIQKEPMDMYINPPEKMDK